MFGGGGGSLSLRSLRELDMPALRFASAVALAHPCAPRPTNILLVTLPFGRGFSCHSRYKQKRATLRATLFCLLVEAAGVEPASASTLPLALHA